MRWFTDAAADDEAGREGHSGREGHPRGRCRPGGSDGDHRRGRPTPPHTGHRLGSTIRAGDVVSWPVRGVPALARPVAPAAAWRRPASDQGTRRPPDLGESPPVSSGMCTACTLPRILAHRNRTRRWSLAAVERGSDLDGRLQGPSNGRFPWQSACPAPTGGLLAATRRADQAPADQAPADQAPADQAPADQAPADQAPATIRSP
jgi:hypothetical protein